MAQGRFIRIENALLILRDESYRASVELAASADRSRCSKPTSIARQVHQDAAAKNCKTIFAVWNPQQHLTSIAPTGTISMTADNVSSGIEPVFSLRGNRTVNMSDGPREVDFNDYGLWQGSALKARRAIKSRLQEHLTF
jgi:ribonucleoside-diphosphate reductase alpha chain